MRSEKSIKFKHIFFVFACCLLTAAAAHMFTGCKSGGDIPKLSGDTQYNVLFITLDTTRADRIGCYGFEKAETPNIDKLAEKGVMFKNSYTSVPLTLPAHCTIFTGREPIAHNVRNNGTYFLNQSETTMAEVMAKNGFSTHAVISAFVLLAKFGLNQGFQVYEDSLSYSKRLKYSIRAEKVYAKFKSWLEQHHQERFFSWLHFYDPHTPYDPPGEFAQRFKDDPYSGEIAYVDHYIGKIVKELDAKGLRDKTLIVIVGDHGEAFGEHKEVGHGIFCYDESLKVPLIFHNPTIWKDKKVVNRRANLLDIMPTILHLFNIPIPEGVQGKSMAHLMGSGNTGEEKDPPQYFESIFGKEDLNWAPVFGIIVNQHKYISLPQPELYDLKADPLEKNNIYKKQNRLAKKLDKELQQYMVKYAVANQQSKRKMSGQDQQVLKSLGYISNMSDGSGTVMDPKKGIDIMLEMERAKKEYNKGNIEVAEKALDALLAAHPGGETPAEAYEYLHDIYIKRKDLKSAEEILKKAEKAFPQILWVKLRIAQLYATSDRFDEAIQYCTKLLKNNPKYNQANLLMIQIYKTKGQPKEVVKYYAKAIEIEPSNPELRIDYSEALLAVGNTDAARTILLGLLKNAVFLDDPDNLPLKSRLGYLLGGLGEYDQAISLCDRLISNGQKSSAILNQLGMAYYKKGRLPEALKAYQDALAWDNENKPEKDNPLTYSNLGTIHLTMARLKKDSKPLAKAIEYFLRSEKADPNQTVALNGLAVAYSYAGQRNKSITYWERALKINPNYIDLYFNLGITYIQLGKKRQALNYLTQCKDKFYSRLNFQQQRQLDNLIREARGQK